MLQIVREKKNVELLFIIFFHVYANTLHTSILNLIVPHHRLEVVCTYKQIKIVHYKCCLALGFPISILNH